MSSDLRRFPKIADNGSMTDARRSGLTVENTIRAQYFPWRKICPIILSHYLKCESIPALLRFISEKIFSLWVKDFVRKLRC